MKRFEVEALHQDFQFLLDMYLNITGTHSLNTDLMDKEDNSLHLLQLEGENMSQEYKVYKMLDSAMKNNIH